MYNPELLAKLAVEVDSKDLYFILDDIIYEYARFALMAEEPDKGFAGQLYYLKLLRDTLGAPC
jgi:hypothetical protein